MVLDINPGLQSANPSGMVAIGSVTYFTADDGVHGVELWKTDGTATGTTLVKDIYPGSSLIGDPINGFASALNSSKPIWLTNVNGTLFFQANDGTHGLELWKSDGTEAGTTLVKDIYPGSRWIGNDPRYAPEHVVNSSAPGWLTNFNGTLFFQANDGTHGLELWKSDGTEAGTTLVKDINSGGSKYGPNSSSPVLLTNVNGTLFFQANAGNHGLELWKSDGTAGGTTLVKDIRPDNVGASPRWLTNVNGTLFFSANDGTHGWELWKSDGTAAGTTLVKDIRAGSEGSGSSWEPGPSNLTNFNGTLFFQANDGTHGLELWKSDGTEAGTVLVKDMNPGSANSYPTSLTNVNGTLFFTAKDGTHGWELWKSDGTEAGTVLVKDINPGAAWSGAQSLTDFNGTLFFGADDGSHGVELWKSDGTAAGTTLVKDIDPGSIPYYDYYGNWYSDIPNSSSPVRLTNVNGTLFFTASDGVHGRELWTLSPSSAPGPSPFLSINDVTVAEGNTGMRTVTFTVTLSAASDEPVTVNYTTANGTATAGSDYQASSGTLTIPIGQTTGTIIVLVNGDRVAEANETFFVNLSSPTNATITDGQGVGFIVDDEPRLSINDVSKIESNSGTTVFRFTVTLASAYDETVTINFDTADGTAKAGSDYQSQSGTLTFLPGETVKYIDVIVYGDTNNEADEFFLVQLSNASNNLWVDDWVGEGWIVNDDTSPGRKGGKKK